MTMLNALFVFLLVFSAEVTATAVQVHQVSVGSMAILPCPSNEDTQHRFSYWQIGDDQVVGPGNPFNSNKYHYEVWSGRLFIKSVSTNESGLYKCISKHISNAGLNIQAVELIVTKDWEQVYEEDPRANTYRSVIAVLVLFILILLGVFAYFIRTRRTRNFVDMPRENSPDLRQKAYNPTTTSTSSGRGRGLENAIVETDIKTSFALDDYP